MNKKLSSDESRRDSHAAAENISDLEKNVICEVANIVVGAATTALSKMIEKKVEISSPELHITTRKLLRVSCPLPFIVMKIRYTDGFVGENLLVINKKDAVVIEDLMMGGSGVDASAQRFNETHLSAMSEVMNQMMGSAASSLSFMFNRKVIISTPEFPLFDGASRSLSPILEDGDGQFLRIAFKILVAGLIDSEILQIMPIEFAKEMARFLISEITQG